jgi:hypothetical protein
MQYVKEKSRAIVRFEKKKHPKKKSMKARTCKIEHTYQVGDLVQANQ